MASFDIACTMNSNCRKYLLGYVSSHILIWGEFVGGELANK